jgi:hypothetical protein
VHVFNVEVRRGAVQVVLDVDRLDHIDALVIAR